MRIKADAIGNTIHIILEVTDDGSPTLYSYRRTVITGRESTLMTSEQASGGPSSPAA